MTEMRDKFGKVRTSYMDDLPVPQDSEQGWVDPCVFNGKVGTNTFKKESWGMPHGFMHNLKSVNLQYF